MTTKTLSQAIAELEYSKDNCDPYCCKFYIDDALKIIREQDRRIELLREALELMDAYLYATAKHSNEYQIVSKALSYTSPDAEWEV